MSLADATAFGRLQTMASADPVGPGLDAGADDALAVMVIDVVLRVHALPTRGLPQRAQNAVVPEVTAIDLGDHAL